MSEALNVYLKILVEFLFEYLVFVALTAANLRKRDFFAFRAVASVLAIFAIAFPLSFVYVAIGETVVGRIAIYVFLYAVTVLLALWCFDESFTTALFCCSLAYTAQNFTYKLWLLLWVVAENVGIDSGWGASYELIYRIIYYTVFAAAAVGLYFMLIGKFTDRLSNTRYDTGMLAVSLIVLLVTVVLCSIEDVYFDKLAVEKNIFDDFTLIMLRETGNIFSLVCLAIVMFLISATVRQREMKQEIEFLQHTIEQGGRQYEMRKDIVDMVNMRVHDIKYRINALLAENGSVSDAELTKLKNSVFIYDSVADTGNTLLNILLSEKRLYCEQNGIKFSCMADGGELSFMSDGDLYTFFGNILDNALEAVKNVTDQSKRVVNLIVKRRNNLLFLQEENYFEGEITFKDGLPDTVKADKFNHGFGVKSIRLIAQKYGGEVSMYVTGEIFHLNVVFSLN